MFHQLIPWITAGFLMMIITGMLLLWSEPVKCYNSIWFRLKVLFLFLAGSERADLPLIENLPQYA